METISEWLDRREYMACSSAISELRKRSEMQSPFRGHCSSQFSFKPVQFIPHRLSPFLTEFELLLQMTMKASTPILGCRGGRVRFREASTFQPQSLWELRTMRFTFLTHPLQGWWRPRDPPQEVTRSESQCKLHSTCHCHGKSQRMPMAKTFDFTRWVFQQGERLTSVRRWPGTLKGEELLLII